MMKIQRNEPCHCMSGKKYKKCCLAADESKAPILNESEPKEPSFCFALRPHVQKQCDKALDILSEGDIVTARKMIQELYMRYPDDYNVHFAFGIYYFKKEQLADASYYFEKAFEICPLLTEALYNLGALSLSKGDVIQAIQYFRRIQKIDIDDEIRELAQDQLSHLEKNIQKFEGLALDQYIEVEQLIIKATDCLKKRQFKQAIENFEKILLIKPDHVKSLGNIGTTYSLLGNKAKALEYIDKALALDPHYEMAVENRHKIMLYEDLNINGFNLYDTFDHEEFRW